VAEKYAQHTSENSRFTLIRFKDNGIGFEEKYLENVFTLFERLHTKDKFEGTGIGLAIARKIIEKHGGAITAQSKIGLGAEFLIWLPMQ
jgi:two-component system CheB/CheR fusion protein